MVTQARIIWMVHHINLYTATFDLIYCNTNYSIDILLYKTIYYMSIFILNGYFVSRCINITT